MGKEEFSVKKMTKEDFRKSIGGSCFMLLFIGSIVGLSVLYNKQQKDHFNIVIENKGKKLLVEDVNTKEQRILEWAYDSEDFSYIQNGDTVNAKFKEDKYTNSKHLMVNKSSLNFNTDSLRARKQREIFNIKKQEMPKIR